MSALMAQVRVSRQLSPPLAKAIRVSVGVSQQQVAKELGVHRVSIARWESGERRPRGHLLTAYTDLLRELQEIPGGA